MQPDSPQARDYVLIQDLAADDRPREKAMRNGIKTLSKAELIAIIFGNGIKGKSVLTMSQELLARNGGSLSTLARKSIKELVKENPGIGPAKAIALAAAIELHHAVIRVGGEARPGTDGKGGAAARGQGRLGQ